MLQTPLSPISTASSVARPSNRSTILLKLDYSVISVEYPLIKNAKTVTRRAAATSTDTGTTMVVTDMHLFLPNGDKAIFETFSQVKSTTYGDYFE